jgi:hypothetical protein
MYLLRRISICASTFALISATALASALEEDPKLEPKPVAVVAPAAAQDPIPAQTILIPVQDRSNEIIDLLSREEAYFKKTFDDAVNELAPQNPWRTSLNGLASNETVMLAGRSYKIDGDRDSFVKSLPSAMAVYSNSLRPLQRASIGVSKVDGSYSISVSYTCPDSLVAKMPGDRTLKIIGRTSSEETFELNFCQQKIEGAQKLRARVEQRRSDIITLPQIDSKNEDLAGTMANISGFAKEYEKLLALREGFSYFKTGMKDGDRKYAAFMKNLVQFRLFLQDKSEKAVTLDDKGKMVEFNREFLSSAKTLHSSLLQFIPWAQGAEIENKGLASFFEIWLKDTPSLK